jgi:hypothetical protein
VETFIDEDAGDYEVDVNKKACYYVDDEVLERLFLETTFEVEALVTRVETVLRI